MRRSLLRSLAVALAVTLAGAGAAPALAAGEPAGSRRADLDREVASADVRHVADWALHSGDHAGMPFVIVDKVEARLFVFDPHGRLLGASPALLGLARGDQSAPDIGSRKLSTITPQERTTPAGRFVANLDRSLSGEEILWVDYDSGVAIHRVIATVPKERRLQRLESALALEKRITFGCINVPVQFYDKVVSPAFTGTNGIVYVLPETRSPQEVFGSYDVAGRQDASPPASSR